MKLNFPVSGPVHVGMGTGSSPPSNIATSPFGIVVVTVAKYLDRFLEYFRLPEVPKTSWKERPMMERVIICKKYIIQ